MSKVLSVLDVLARVIVIIGLGGLVVGLLVLMVWTCFMSPLMIIFWVFMAAFIYAGIRSGAV